MNYTPAEYQAARREHAFLLRCEGLTLREIGERLSGPFGYEHARQMIDRFGQNLNKKIQRAKFSIQPGVTG